MNKINNNNKEGEGRMELEEGQKSKKNQHQAQNPQSSHKIKEKMIQKFPKIRRKSKNNKMKILNLQIQRLLETIKILNNRK